MSDNCVSQPPSGRERVDGASPPPETWSFLDRDSVASLTMSGPGSSWDKEYLDYTPPEHPPEPSEQGWVDRWNLWKNENDSFSQHCFEADPILMHFNKAAGPVQVSTQAITLDGFNIDSKDDADQIKLLLAAEKGDEETVRMLRMQGINREAFELQGRTAVSWAAANGHNGIVRQLRSHNAKGPLRSSMNYVT
ncbi:hypothetical protein EDB80DRAFT_294900 [Ilyonectria destructans]|nr:hypothetical protein EDB80DRAFT_294900 [Ilyonectria destructans]